MLAYLTIHQLYLGPVVGLGILRDLVIHPRLLIRQERGNDGRDGKAAATIHVRLLKHISEV